MGKETVNQQPAPVYQGVIPVPTRLERLLWMNEDDGKGYPDYQPGTVPVVIQKYPYEKGYPVPGRINLKTEKFYFPDDKAVALEGFEFTPLAVFNLGKAVMYPTPDPTTKELILKKRNQLAVIAALPQFDGMIVSFLISSYGAEAFLAQTKMQHKSEHGFPPLCPQQLVYIVAPYENNSHGYKFCSLRFSVRVATPRYGLDLQELVKKRDFFCKEHIVEFLARNPASEQNPPAFLREVGKMLTPDEVSEIFALVADKKRDNSRLDGNEEEEEGEDAGHLYAPAPVYAPVPLAAPVLSLNAAPADQGKTIKPEWAAAYRKQYDKIVNWMSDDEKRYYTEYEGYDDFVKKGTLLRKLEERMSHMAANVDELPF